MPAGMTLGHPCRLAAVPATQPRQPGVCRVERGPGGVLPPAICVRTARLDRRERGDRVPRPRHWRSAAASARATAQRVGDRVHEGKRVSSTSWTVDGENLVHASGGSAPARPLSLLALLPEDAMPSRPRADAKERTFNLLIRDGIANQYNAPEGLLIGDRHHRIRSSRIVRTSLRRIVSCSGLFSTTTTSSRSRPPGFCSPSSRSCQGPSSSAAGTRCSRGRSSRSYASRVPAAQGSIRS